MNGRIEVKTTQVTPDTLFVLYQKLHTVGLQSAAAIDSIVPLTQLARHQTTVCLLINHEHHAGIR